MLIHLDWQLSLLDTAVCMMTVILIIVEPEIFAGRKFSPIFPISATTEKKNITIAGNFHWCKNLQSSPPTSRPSEERFLWFKLEFQISLSIDMHTLRC